jgi:hypothetical protein
VKELERSSRSFGSAVSHGARCWLLLLLVSMWSLVLSVDRVEKEIMLERIEN